jgi:C4-dicarboxylate transporter DctQ subunit
VHKKFFAHFEEYAILVLFPIMVSVVLLATFARYSQLFSMFWGEELARYTMVYLGYIGIALAMKRRAHIGVTMLVDRAKSKGAKQCVLIVQTVFILIFCAIISAFLFEVIRRQMIMGQTTPALELPMWLPYAGVPVGMVLLGIRVCQAFWRDWQFLQSSSS